MKDTAMSAELEKKIEELAEKITKRVADDAIKLAIVRNRLARDDGEEFDEDELVEDTAACLTGDDIGCGEEEDADDPAICAAAFVREALRSLIPLVRKEDAEMVASWSRNIGAEYEKSKTHYEVFRDYERGEPNMTIDTASCCKHYAAVILGNVTRAIESRITEKEE